ncbi:MAG: hypothetical protein CSA49_05740 [Gammaproteobacteria bacterium]|nr:MAG: hypothetical protein CSA49_05740 [Gammaproteobacteria bacterium]
MSEALSFYRQAVLKPGFKSKVFDFKAGTAFVVNFEGHYVLLTAMHLFGPAGGLNKKYSGEELAALDITVTARACDTHEVILASSNVLTFKGAKGRQPATTADDLFAVSVVECSAFKLAKKLPSVGDKVSLVARLKKQKPGDTMLHPATVVAVANDYIEYKFDNKRLNPGGASGAPVINEAGEVIGMNLVSAGIPMVNRKGRANTALNLRQRLRSALS